MHPQLEYWSRLLDNYDNISILLGQFEFPGDEDTFGLKELLHYIIGSISSSPELMTKEILSTKTVPRSLGLRFFDLRECLLHLIELFTDNLRLCENILFISKDCMALTESSIFPEDTKQRITLAHEGYRYIESSLSKCKSLLHDIYEQMFVTNSEVLKEYEEEQRFQDFLDNFEKELEDDELSRYEESRSFPNAWEQY